MKKLFKFKFVIIALALTFITVSCEKDLDLTENPNYLSPEQGNADFYLNSIQINFAYFVEAMGTRGGELTRIYHFSSRDYDGGYSPATSDYPWRLAYASILSDIKKMNEIVEPKGLSHHAGIGKVIKAYTLMTLVDFYGDVPYSEMLQGSDNTNPNVDDAASVYQSAIDLLNSAMTDFDDNPPGEPENDFYYGGDWAKWKKLANTLKMKAYMTTRLVDSNALTEFNNIVTSGEYISSNDEDFQFRWGKNDVNPDSRHPRYSDNYTSTGGQEYMSNHLMAYMVGNDANAYLSPNRFDPRTLFYFYRQVSATPGQGGEPADEETIECSLQTPPSHYAGYVFCGLPKGWWGRDHGNDNGIPPDGFLRTLAGVYPCGGALDDLSYSAKVKGDGEGGNGITPIMLASWVKFMIAEYHMLNNDFANAKSAMMEGVDMSIDKVTNLYPTTDRFNLIFSGNPGYLPTLQQYIDWFKADLEGEWDGTTTDDEKWEILANQYFVALYGNGIDAYNFYRRTGYPHHLQPNLEPNPGPFIRSFYYSANFVNNNSNVSQKPNVATQVFWDTNPASPGFPQAN